MAPLADAGTQPETLRMRRLMTFIAAVLMGLLFVSCGPIGTALPDRIEAALHEAPEGTAPLHLDDGLALVPVSIGDQGPFLFVVDTGASRTLLAPTTRDRLGFAPHHGRFAPMTGATGDGNFQHLPLRSITVAGHTVSDLAVAVVDLTRFESSSVRYDGVLGQDFLGRFDFSYDLQQAEIQLHRRGDDAEPPFGRLDTLMQTPILPTEFGDGLITLELSIGGRPARGILDTGSSSTILNWIAARQDGVDPEHTHSSEPTYGIGYVEPTRTQRFTFEHISTGNVLFTPREVSIADLPVFEALNLDTQAAALIGNDLLENRFVVVSNSTRTLYFSTARDK